MSDTPMTQAHAQLERARHLLADVRERHEKELKGAIWELEEAERTLAHARAGTSPDVKLHAEHVIQVSGEENCRVGEGASVIRDAISDLVAGGKALVDTQRSTKTYEGFVGQREDHKYGFGPRHGSIIFSVGLNEPVRKRLWQGGELTAEEIESAITFLSNLEAKDLASA